MGPCHGMSYGQEAVAWKAEMDVCSLAEGAFHGHLSAMQLDEVATQGKAKARPTVFPADHQVGLLERFKQVFHVFF